MITETQILDVVNVVTTGVAGVVGWVVGRRKQKNDFLSELQNSIDLLAEKNKQQMEEILSLRDRVIRLQDENSVTRKQQTEEIVKLNMEVVKLRDENFLLRKEVEALNEKLQNVGTIL